jgi:hypothetical protein
MKIFFAISKVVPTWQDEYKITTLNTKIFSFLALFIDMHGLKAMWYDE